MTIKILVNSRIFFRGKAYHFGEIMLKKSSIIIVLSVLCHKKLGLKNAKCWNDFFSVSKYMLYHFHLSTLKNTAGTCTKIMKIHKILDQMLEGSFFKFPRKFAI